MKKFVLLSLIAALLLCASFAVAEPVTSYADVQDALLLAAYKVKPLNVKLSGTVAAVIQSYSNENGFYLFVLVDDEDVSFWSTEDDNYFVAMVYSHRDVFPFVEGDAVTVEGQLVPIYSSPICPYIMPLKINGIEEF